MLKFLKRLLVPTRFDAVCVAIAIHWIVAVLSVTILPLYANSGLEAILIESVAAGTWLAIAATVVWKASSKRRVLLLLISSLASLIFVVVWHCLNADFLQSQWKANPNGYSSGGFETDFFLYQTSVRVFWGIALAAIVWLVNRFVIYAISKSKNLESKAGQLFRGDRTKLLVIAAALLFVIAIAGRVLPSLGQGAVLIALSLTGIILAWAVVLFWFPRSFAFKGMPIQKAVSLLLVAVVFVPLVFSATEASGPLLNIAALVSGIVFIFSVLGTAGRKTVESIAPQDAESETAPAVAASMPSLFSLVPVLLVSATIAIPWFFDLATLVSTRPGAVVSFTQQFEFARESAIVKWNSGGRIKPYFSERNGVVTWKVQLDDDAPADLLDPLAGPGFNHIELCNLNPEFDLSVISGQGKVVNLINSEVTHSQLNDIVGSTPWMEVEGDFSIVDDGTFINPGSFSSVSFRDTPAGAVSAFFKATKCEKQMSYVIMHTPAANEDWATIEQVAQSGHVYLYAGWSDDFQMPKQTLPLKRVHFYDLHNQEEEVKLDKNLILNTDIDLLYGRNLPKSLETTWNLTMLRGSADFNFHSGTVAGSDKTLAEHAKELGMAYQFNDDQTIHSLFYPWGSRENVASLKNLKVVSFDPGWVGAEVGRALGDPIGLRHLVDLTGVEELYFEPSLVPQDLSFFNGLQSLKHLQIPAVVRKVTGPVGFDKLQSLESITFLGTPDSRSYREVAKLKNLKRLVIVNFDEDVILTPEYRDKLAEKLPGVEVEILEPAEKESLIPQTFRDYRDRVRKELREDTSWLD